MDRQPPARPPLALLSVSDKSGLVELAQALAEAGFVLLSTGGTAARLAEAGLPVRTVESRTGHPEIMDGRVKTLHPRIHGGILGRRDLHAGQAEAHDIEWIDVVVVNLYPFQATVLDSQGQPRPDLELDEAIEQIDIGGPAMIRSAAKNHAFVTVLTRPEDYPAVIAELKAGGVSASTRLALAVRAFQHTAAYDAVIAGWLARRAADLGAIPAEEARFPREGALPIRRVQACRYGENPHQGAAFYETPGLGGRRLPALVQHQGKELSFNNLADLDAALRVAFEDERPAAVIIKHANPCGAGLHRDGPAAAFELALSGDPVSAFGGVLAFNRPLGEADVRAIRQSRVFFEIIAAPAFEPAALELLRPRENLRVIELPPDWARRSPAGPDIKRVQGGLLLQDWDDGPLPAEWKVTSRAAPSDEELATLRFAWGICRHVKSNAIVLARAVEGGFVLNGVGAGQMSRVDSVRMAIAKATRPVPGSVLAGDAFFPFPDGPQLALEAGVRAFVQPGGSVRDAEVLAAIDAAGASMVFTGLRHFRH